MTALVSTAPRMQPRQQHEAHPAKTTKLPRTKEIKTEDICPLMACDEYRGRPIPALPVHCVLESIEKHGAELTRRHILRACGLSHMAHRSDVLSLCLLDRAARRAAAKLALSTGSQRVRRLAAPFPFVDFRVPGDEDFHANLREYRLRRNSKKAEENFSSPVVSFDPSQLLLAIAPGHEKAVFTYSSPSSSEDAFSSSEYEESDDETTTDDSAPLFRGVALQQHEAYSTDAADADEDEETDDDEEEDGEEEEEEEEDLSEGEVDCESEYEEEGEIRVD